MNSLNLDWLVKELRALARELGRDPRPDALPLVIAIDQGGHASRAIAFDLTGRQIADSYVNVATSHAAGERVEQDPHEVVRSVTAVLGDLSQSLGEACERVLACGLATQRSSIVCWDRTSGEPLSPVLSWQDRRNSEWLESLRQEERRIQEITGLVLSAHYGASKLRWCLDHLADVQAALRRGRLAFGPLASFLLAQLVPERPAVVDPANASRTLLWDPNTRDWSPALLELFAIPGECLPAVVTSRHEFGMVEVGSRRVPLVVCTGDQCAAAYAMGAPGRDVVKFNAGTGGFLLTALEEPPPAQTALLRSVLWADDARVTFALEATINGAGSALDWLATRIATEPHRAARSLDRTRVADLDVPLFLNAVGGLGSPYWLPDARPAFVGEGEELAQIAAILESIAFLARTNVDAMRAINPDLARIEATGGLAASPYLCEALADCTGMPVEQLSLPQATACGLAFLTAAEPQAWHPETNTRTFLPQPDASRLERYVRWQRAMQKSVAVLR